MQNGSPRTVYDELLIGVVDVHCHVDFEFSATAFRKALPEWEWLPRAEKAGMRGVVLKSHLWPSVALAPFLSQLYPGTVEVATSITLNPTVGGLDPWAVEAAVQMGAKAVFLPTWGAVNDHVRGGFHRRLASAFEHFDPQRLSTLSITDEAGGLLDSAQEILRLAQQHELMLSTGHVSWEETLVLAREAQRIGFDRLLFGHPLSGSIGAPVEAVHEAASLGAYIEVCWPTISPGRHDPAEVVSLMKDVGPSRFVLTSDFFAGNQPSPSDLLRLLLGALYDHGLSQEEVQVAAARNPAALIGMPAA
jgi:hypothetical protein